MKLPARRSFPDSLETGGPGRASGKGNTPHRSCLKQLTEFIRSSRHLLILTGAGCSTESGIPDYRDGSGNWKVRPPMNYRSFVSSRSARQRYWARSFHGWKRIAEALPNPAHLSLARLEAHGRLLHVVTQNVDSLHQKAGSRKVIDLHGRLDMVQCLRCSYRSERQSFQRLLAELNPKWQAQISRPAPDGDAELAHSTEDFLIPECPGCGGILKPGIVFFGETVPRCRVDFTNSLLQESDALLVVGSSLMVWSGYRFASAAARQGIPVAAVNLGVTRADDLLHTKVELPCGVALSSVIEGLER